MKLFSKGKDGGPKSTVTGYWLCEFKKLFSVALLKFEGTSREEYHNHAFDSVSWLLKGHLRECELNSGIRFHYPSFKPIVTRRSDFHKVHSDGTSWVLTIRGPWSEFWQEYSPRLDKYITLKNGRVEV
jgi:hypothetical protein